MNQNHAKLQRNWVPSVIVDFQMGNSDGVCSCVQWAKQSGAEGPKFAGFCSKTFLISFDWTVYAAGESYCPVPICDELMNCGCGDKFLPYIHRRAKASKFCISKIIYQRKLSGCQPSNM